MVEILIFENWLPGRLKTRCIRFSETRCTRFQTTSLSDSGYKQPDGADKSARPHCRTQARFVFQIAENISNAKGDERYCQKVDGRLRGIACGVCHQNGGGKRGEHFKAVLLRGIGARRQALRAGEEIARIAVVRRLKTALRFGDEGTKQRQQRCDQDAPIG